MRTFILAVAGLLTATFAKAQERPAFTQYMVNPYVINPAVAGTDDYWNIKAGTRYQWTGLEDAPRTYYLSAHGAISGDDRRARQGVGGLVMRDEFGPISNTTLAFSYAYQVDLTTSLKLSAGAGVGLHQFRLDVDGLTFGDPDPVADEANRTRFSPSLSLGLWLKDDRFFAGVSAYQMPREATAGGDAGWYYYFTGGYNIPAGRNLTITPAALVTLRNTSQRTVEANVRMLYKDVAWGGVSYRHNKAITAMAGISVATKFEFGYSFDFLTGRPADLQSNGAHEFMLGVRIR